jgi:hypothetical protein
LADQGGGTAAAGSKRVLKWRFDRDQNATGRDLRLVTLAADPIDTGLDSDFLTVQIIGAGRQA